MERSESLLREIKSRLKGGERPARLLRNVIHRKGALQSVRFLLEHGADVKQNLAKGELVLLNTFEGDMRERLEMIQLLWKYVGDTNIEKQAQSAIQGAQRDSEGWGRPFTSMATPLEIVCFGGGIEVVKFIVEQAVVDANWVLHTACHALHFNTVEFLLSSEKAQVDVNGTDNCQRYTPLHYACGVESCSLEIAKLLVAKEDIDINAKCTRWMTPLHFASKRRNAEVVRLLLQNHANVHAVDRGRATPLHLVCYDPDSPWNDQDSADAIATIPHLLEKGADVNATDRWGHTPLSLACKIGVMGVVDFLLTTGGADLNIGMSPLYAATAFGHFAVAEKLLKHGASFDDSRLPNDKRKEILLLGGAGLRAAAPVFARKRSIQGQLELTLVEIAWSDLHLHFGLLTDELDALQLTLDGHNALTVAKCLRYLTKNCSIQSLQVNTNKLCDYKQVCSAICELLEQNSNLQELTVGPKTKGGRKQRGRSPVKATNIPQLARDMMQSLVANSTVIAFSAYFLIPDCPPPSKKTKKQVTQGSKNGKKAGKKAATQQANNESQKEATMITQRDVNCVCFRNRSMPLMKVGHEVFWPRIFHQVGNSSEGTEWGSSALYGLVCKAAPLLTCRDSMPRCRKRKGGPMC